jgi:N-acetylglucosamine kinase-like BadF-type ATPase
MVNGQPDATPAITLICGTGANCLGRGVAGEFYRVSGLDYILSDEGSGYDMGRLTLKAAVMSADGRSEHTELATRVYQHFHVTDAPQLKTKVYNPALSKNEIASLAKICVRAMRAGDLVAQGIVAHCLSHLLLDVRTVVRHLQLTTTAFTFIPAGSLLLNILDLFSPQLQSEWPLATITQPATPPVHGALAIAQAIYQGADPHIYDIF